MIVLDSSALIAYARRETGWERVEPVLSRAMASTVNLAEVAQCLLKLGLGRETIVNAIAAFNIVAIAPDTALAINAGMMKAATAKRGLSLADRFCLALARREGAVALTADRAWAGVAEAVGVSVETIR